MPEIARFLGIVIYIYFDDHPPAHFHARYGRQVAVIDIATLAVLRGCLSPRVLGLVTEWASAHQQELRENWQRARAHANLLPIQPLE